MASRWYVRRDGEEFGPFLAPELKQLALRGELGPGDLVRKEDSPNWVPAERVQGLLSRPPAPTASSEPVVPASGHPSALSGRRGHAAGAAAQPAAMAGLPGAGADGAHRPKAIRPKHIVLGMAVLAAVVANLTVAFVLFRLAKDKVASPAMADADDAQAESTDSGSQAHEPAVGEPSRGEATQWESAEGSEGAATAPADRVAMPAPGDGPPVSHQSPTARAAAPVEPLKQDKPATPVPNVAGPSNSFTVSGLPVDPSRPYEPSTPLIQAVDQLSQAEQMKRHAGLRMEYEAQYGPDGGDFYADEPAEDARREASYEQLRQQVFLLARSEVDPLRMKIERTAKRYDPDPSDDRHTLVLTEESRARLLELLLGHLDIDAEPLPASLAWNTMLRHFAVEIWAEQVSVFRFEPAARYRAYAQGRPDAVAPAAVVQDRSFQAMLVKTYHLGNVCRQLSQLTRPVAAAEELLRWRLTLEGDERPGGERDLLVYRINTALHTGRYDEAVQLAWDEKALEEDAWGTILTFSEPDPWIAALGRLVQGGIEENVHNLEGLQALDGQLELIGELARGHGKRPVEESLVALRAEVDTAVTAEEASLAALNYPSIHEAAANNDVEDVKRHLARGADIDAETTLRHRKGLTPVYCAASSGHPEMVRFLLDHGADIEAGPSEGFNVLTAVLQPDPADGQPIDEWLDVSKLLLDAGADPTVTDQSGATCLHGLAFAANDRDDKIEYYLKLAEMLIEAGADVNANAAVGGRTPLHFAVARGNVRMVEILLEHGADANAQGSDGITPMDLAARGSGRDPLVQMLRRAGGRPSGNPRRR